MLIYPAVALRGFAGTDTLLSTTSGQVSRGILEKDRRQGISRRRGGCQGMK